MDFAAPARYRGAVRSGELESGNASRYDAISISILRREIFFRDRIRDPSARNEAPIKQNATPKRNVIRLGGLREILKIS